MTGDVSHALEVLTTPRMAPQGLQRSWAGLGHGLSCDRHEKHLV